MTCSKPVQLFLGRSVFCGLLAVMLMPLVTGGAEFQQKGAAQEQETKKDESASGQALLDEAFELKLTARTGQDFAKVVQRCEEAIKKGLDKENEKFARRLMTSTLYQYVSRICQPILKNDRPDASWRQRRAAAMPLLKKLLEVDDTFGDALVLTARLEMFPGGDAKRSRQLLDKAIVVFKEDNEKLSEALSLRAGLEMDAKKKMADLDRAIKLDPSNTAAWQARALTQLRGGRFEQAAQDLEALLEKDSDNYLAMLALAEAMANLRKTDEAIELAGRAIKLEPEVPQAYELRARIHVLTNAMNLALVDVNQALHLQPGSYSSLLLRARLFQAQEKFDEALKDVETALKVRPKTVSALFLKSSIYETQRKFDRASATMRQVVILQPDNEQARLMLGMYYSMASKVKKALIEFDLILAKNKGNTAALYWRADTRLNIGDHQGARKDYERVLEANPKHEATLNNLAWLLATSPEDALRDGKRAIELARQASESSQYKKPHILSTLAAAYAETGAYDKAVEWSNKAVKLGRDDIQGQLEAELKSYQQEKPWREKKELLESKDVPNKGT
jgi:tetratricopeptide (TPR) repeat protein